jgi:hypothetical protein
MEKKRILSIETMIILSLLSYPNWINNIPANMGNNKNGSRTQVPTK